MPKLIGMWKLPFPRVRKTHPAEAREIISQIATDEDGQQWGLVVRVLRLGDGVSRLDPVRWVRWEATPFAPTEIVTDTGWDAEPRSNVSSAAGAAGDD